MTEMPKLLITAGILLIVVGLAWKLIGRLPGDIFVKKGNVTFYFPIITCIVLSIVLSFIMYIINRFK
ncbi:TPA: DUF2905 domain-containing protein [Bacillus cereus]|uniref:DUF2905 domain-containing protein n=1 Tax=Bacillus cereus TaxID=1396 RepID=UPI0007FB4DE5|nr:DUF2905 domain-containing protein [Bacillus cereus]MCM3219443.1 DUF2905 domain-containing protein [Bacillus cereus]MCU4928615.1 DUF2905 domain-containing protein [Bacillus cereus]OBW57684.1 hypothetical protein A9987_02405 [Bacillus cereus]TKH32174.1 DUF2905 domain-containing protein [Bacillus cereus]HDU9004377.1 DUF2905 domain-containing protein [Bacillus cereus]